MMTAPMAEFSPLAMLENNLLQEAFLQKALRLLQGQREQLRLITLTSSIWTLTNEYAEPVEKFTGCTWRNMHQIAMQIAGSDVQMITRIIIGSDVVKFTYDDAIPPFLTARRVANPNDPVLHSEVFSDWNKTSIFSRELVVSQETIYDDPS